MKQLEKFKKQLERNQKILLIVGIIFLTYGVLRFILVNPNFGVNLKTLQPSVVNGSLAIAFGACAIIGWALTRKHKKTIIAVEEKEILEKKKVSKKR